MNTIIVIAISLVSGFSYNPDTNMALYSNKVLMRKSFTSEYKVITLTFDDTTDYHNGETLTLPLAVWKEGKDTVIAKN